jgi:hypothetical protein
LYFFIPIQAGYDLWAAFHVVESDTWKETGVVFPSTPPPSTPTPKPQAECVLTTKELIKAVKECDKVMNETMCLIDICNNRLLMSAASISSKELIYQTRISIYVVTSNVRLSDVSLMDQVLLACSMDPILI